MNKANVTTGDAIKLAHAFATYRSYRVADLDTALDADLAISAATYLRRVQRDVGIEIVEENKLDATVRRLSNYANAVDKGANAKDRSVKA